MNYQILKEIKWSTNIILLFYFLKHNCDVWFVNGELIDTTRKGEKKEYVDLSDMLPLEGDEEEVEQWKGLKNVTPNKLLTRLPILLRQIKAENNSYIFCINTIKLSKGFTTI